jgi:nitrite reductase (NADH) small subunit
VNPAGVMTGAAALDDRLVGFVWVGSGVDVPPLEGRSVSVDGRRVAIFRTERGLAAIDAACPHHGGPLSDGIVAGDCVTCPLHGLRIDLDSGEAAGGDGRVAVHEVLELDGQLWVRLCPAEAR